MKLSGENDESELGKSTRAVWPAKLNGRIEGEMIIICRIKPLSPLTER